MITREDGPVYIVHHEYDDCYFCRQYSTFTPHGELWEMPADELPSGYEGYGPPEEEPAA